MPWAVPEPVAMRLAAITAATAAPALAARAAQVVVAVSPLAAQAGPAELAAKPTQPTAVQPTAAPQLVQQQTTVLAQATAVLVVVPVV